MILLALDTSLDGCSVALLKGDQVLGEKHIAQSGMIFSLVETLLKTHGLAYQDLRAVAVTRGPGSFTGIRLGLAAAQGWSLAGQIPLWGISTLDCLAYQVQEPVRPLLAGISTKRGDFYVSAYDPGAFFASDSEIMSAEVVLTKTSSHRVVLWMEEGHPLYQDPALEKIQLMAASVGQLALHAQQHNPEIFKSSPRYLRPAKVYEINANQH